MSEPALIDITGMSFSYVPGRPVLQDITLRVPRGKVVALLGGSGCGKTTLLRLISAQLLPDSGTVRIDGRLTGELDTRALYRLRREMGMLFQLGALFTDMSVYDNVAFPLREHTDLPEDAVRDLVVMKLQAVGLRGAAGLMPADLSGGMARRVALARALALDPRLVMYDEPFAGLDPISLGVIWRLIRRSNDALGATSVVVTHDVEECLQFVDYVYLMSRGRIVAEGEPAEIRSSPIPMVRQFVHGEPDGPVPFHYPAGDYAEALGLARA